MHPIRNMYEYYVDPWAVRRRRLGELLAGVRTLVGGRGWWRRGGGVVGRNSAGYSGDSIGDDYTDEVDSGGDSGGWRRQWLAEQWRRRGGRE